MITTVGNEVKRLELAVPCRIPEIEHFDPLSLDETDYVIRRELVGGLSQKLHKLIAAH
jgi:hypothetical protein